MATVYKQFNLPDGAIAFSNKNNLSNIYICQQKNYKFPWIEHSQYNYNCYR